MADAVHRLTDEKLEEMEKRLSAIYSGAELVCNESLTTSNLGRVCFYAFISFLRKVNNGWDLYKTT